MITPEHIVALARRTLGTPYGHQGRIEGVALDCAGVPVYVAQQLGYDFTDIVRYGRVPNPAEMRTALDTHLRRVTVETMQIGDVVWLRVGHRPQHFAIVGDYLYGGFSLIHAYDMPGVGKVVEHVLDDAWFQRIAGVWRWPEVGASV